MNDKLMHITGHFNKLKWAKGGNKKGEKEDWFMQYKCAMCS